MAKLYGENTAVDFAAANLMSFGKSFSRLNGQPLDKSEVWYNKADLEAYALTDAAYVGQKVFYVDTEKNTVTHYGIEVDGTLKELGTTPVGDGKSIVVAENGTISLKGVPGLDFVKRDDEGNAVKDEEGNEVKVNYQPLMTEAGLTWVIPSATTVEGLATEIEGLKSRTAALEGVVGKAASEGVEATGLVKSVSDNASAIDAINTKIGTVAEGKTVVEMISDAQEAATYDDTDLTGRVEALEEVDHEHANKAELDKIADGDKAKWDAMEQNAKNYADGLNTTMGNRVKVIEDDYLKTADKNELSQAISDAEDSAVNRVLGYLAEEEINTSYDTLKEVAAWIESDTTNSAQLISRVSAIENDYLKGADKTELQGNIDELVDYVGTFESTQAVFTSTWDDAESRAELTLSYEDYTCISKVEFQNIITGEWESGSVDVLGSEYIYADEGDDTPVSVLLHENSRVFRVYISGRSASNTVIEYIHEVVDGLNIGDYAKASQLTALASRVSTVEGKAHTHTNESVLNGITAEKVTAWDSAEQNAKDYADGLNTAVNEALEDKVSVEEGKSLIADTLIAKLEGIDTGAQVNAIDTVEETELAITDKKLSVKAVAMDKVTGLSDALADKVAVEDGKSLVSDTLITKLEGIAEGAQVNVIDSVDTTQFDIDANKKLTLLEIAMSKVTNLTGALDGKVDKEEGSRLLTEDEATKLEKLVLGDNGEVSVSGKVAAGNVDGLDAWITARAATLKGLSENNLTDTLLAKLNGIDEGAQVNKIEAVKVGDTVLEIVDKTVTIPVGAGLKASDEITIAEDGTLGVGEVNVSKLVQSENEYLILNGGAAAI